MAIARLDMDEAKNYWFDGVLIAYAFVNDHGPEIISLPKVEVDRGLYYLRKLKSCSTYGQAQNLFLEYCEDNKAPKLIPRLTNLEEHIDFLFEMWELNQKPSQLTQEKAFDPAREPNMEELMKNIENLEFVWNQAPPYLDDNELFAACRDMQRWTDAWMPKEIVEVLGVPTRIWYRLLRGRIFI